MALVYSDPRFVTVMLLTFPFTIVAVAVAPVPSPVIVTVGVVVNPAPPFVISIEVTPVNDCGISSNKTVLLIPFLSNTSNGVEVIRLAIVPLLNSALKLIV